MDDLTALISAEETVDLCRRLVRAPSENPPGDERSVADAAAAILFELGLPCERVESAPGRVSLVSGWGDASAGPTLLFNGHYDVVPAGDPAAWPHPPYAATVDGGRIYGRGTTDMKSGIAACLSAVSALLRAGVRPRGRLLMQFVADEEALGVLGAKHLVDHGYCDGVTEAIVGEPTALNLVTAERGALWFRVVTHGVSAHGSSPRLGVNAIEHMSKVVLALQAMRFRKLHETLGGPSVNVGTVRGGSKVNMVPDHCVIEVDRRTLPGETQDEVLGEVQALLDGIGQQTPDLKAHVEIHDWADASETPAGSRVVPLLAEACAALGAEADELGYSGATDARYLINRAGIPTVIFGPGDLLLAHTVGECVEIDQLVACARIYAHAFARFLGVR